MRGILLFEIQERRFPARLTLQTTAISQSKKRFQPSKTYRKASVDSNSEIAKHAEYGITLSSLEELGLNWNSKGWKEFLGYPDDESFLKEMRSNTISGKPFLSEDFVFELEDNTAVSMAKKKRGRPRKGPQH